MKNEPIATNPGDNIDDGEAQLNEMPQDVVWVSTVGEEGRRERGVR